MSTSIFWGWYILYNGCTPRPLRRLKWFGPGKGHAFCRLAVAMAKGGARLECICVVADVGYFKIITLWHHIATSYSLQFVWRCFVDLFNQLPFVVLLSSCDFFNETIIPRTNEHENWTWMEVAERSWPSFNDLLLCPIIYIIYLYIHIDRCICSCTISQTVSSNHA